MLRLDLTQDAADFVTALEAKSARQVWNKIVALMKDPRPSNSIDIGEGYFRTDIGERRIVYRFDAQCLYVAVIGKRNDDEVYRQFRNKK
jgi:mRNA interferase RelE/StbE